MLDYDGTVAPFRKERHEAIPYPPVARVLQEIVRQGHTRVVIISGRDVRDLASLLGIEPLPELWGVHGLQRKMPGGALEIAPIDQSSMEALSDARRWLEYQQLLLHAELKAGSIAVHWRGMNVSEIEELRGRVLLGWTSIARDTSLWLLEFDGGLEIRAPGRNKGDAVRTLLSEMDDDVRAAYLGDDATDEAAFEALGDRGLTLLVRPRLRQTAAQCWLKPPEELLEFFTDWLRACQGRKVDEPRIAAASRE